NFGSADRNQAARRAADRPGRRQPVPAAAAPAETRRGHRHPAAQPGQPRPQPGSARAVHAGRHERHRQRTLVRGLHLRALPASDQVWWCFDQPGGLHAADLRAGSGGERAVTIETRTQRSVYTWVAAASVAALLLTAGLWL